MGSRRNARGVWVVVPRTRCGVVDELDVSVVHVLEGRVLHQLLLLLLEVQLLELLRLLALLHVEHPLRLGEEGPRRVQFVQGYDLGVVVVGPRAHNQLLVLRDGRSELRNARLVPRGTAVLVSIESVLQLILPRAHGVLLQAAEGWDRTLVELQVMV